MCINRLYINAMNKLQTDKSKFTTEDIFTIANFTNNYNKNISTILTNQIIRDINTYKKYDSIAMWVGDGGLIEYEPEFITDLVKLFGIEE